MRIRRTFPMGRIIAAALFVILSVVSAIAETKVIKLAIPVPENTDAMARVIKINADLMKESRGELNVQVFGAGAVGDDFDIIRKLRLNQLQMAILTTAGIHKLFPALSVIETPGLFRTSEEIDYVLSRMHDEFARGFDKKELVLLGIGKVGFSYFSSRRDIQSPEDLNRLRMWNWKGDSQMQDFLEAFGVKTVPLHLLDVKIALENGVIDAVINAPFPLTAFQWFPYTPYFLDMPLTFIPCVIVINKHEYESLSRKSRGLLKEGSRKNIMEWNRMVKTMNAEAMEVMRNAGVKFISPAAEQIPVYEAFYDRILEKALARGLYTREAYDRVKTIVRDFRAAHPDLSTQAPVQ